MQILFLFFSMVCYFSNYGMDEINPNFIGIVADVLTTASIVPQLVKILREKKQITSPYPMPLIFITGLLLWIFYHTMKNDLPLIVNNAFSMVVSFIIVFFSVK